jgi:hypothetical protein
MQKVVDLDDLKNILKLLLSTNFQNDKEFQNGVVRFG